MSELLRHRHIVEQYGVRVEIPTHTLTHSLSRVCPGSPPCLFKMTLGVYQYARAAQEPRSRAHLKRKFLLVISTSIHIGIAVASRWSGSSPTHATLVSQLGWCFCAAR